MTLLSAGITSDHQPPTTPTNVRVTGFDGDSVSLDWDAAADRQGRIDHYEITFDAVAGDDSDGGGSSGQQDP